MGNYTSNYSIFMPSDTDFVDVARDVSDNMDLIDELLWEQCHLDKNDLTWNNQPGPTYSNKHTYSTWDGSVRVYDPEAVNQFAGTANWQETHASPNNWTPFASYLAGGFKDVSGYTTYYRISKSDTVSGDNYLHLELRGRVSLNGATYSPMTQNTVYQLSYGLPGGYLPAVPANGFSQTIRTTMGNSPSSTTIWNSAVITTNLDTYLSSNLAYLTVVRKCGTTAANTQTAGNAENYICLDGVRIMLAAVNGL